MIATIIIIILSIVYSLIFVIIGKLIKSEDIYTRTTKALNSLKEYTRMKSITVDQMHELMADYKVIIIKEAEIYIVSLALFMVFYYYIIPMFIGVNYKLSFLVLSIIFSIAMSLCLYLFNKLVRKKNTDIKV